MSTPYFLDRWAAEGNALVAPLCREIAKIGRALNNITLNGNPAIVTERGVALSAPSRASGTPFVNIFAKTSATEGSWTPGKVYFAGRQLTVADEPATITVGASACKFWIEIDFSYGTAAWKSGSAFPTLPMGDALEWFRMLDVTLDNDDQIDTFLCPTPHDIHVTAKSS